MNIKVTHLPTCWDEHQVYAVIEFLGVLRDQLRETYGDELSKQLARDEHQAQLDFNDDIDF